MGATEKKEKMKETEMGGEGEEVIINLLTPQQKKLF